MGTVAAIEFSDDWDTEEPTNPESYVDMDELRNKPCQHCTANFGILCDWHLIQIEIRRMGGFGG